MKLSIITCTYNSEQYIHDNINSVLNQNLDPNLYEHVFIDGYSSDNTMKILEEYKTNNPNYNITIIQKPAKGIYNAMNEGVKVAKGEYIHILNSDDYLLPNILNDYLKYISNTGELELYYATNNMVNGKGEILYQHPNRFIYKFGMNKYLLGLSCYIFQSTCLYKKKLHNRFGYYNEQMKLASDMEFFIKAAKGKTSNKYYNKITTNFRIHENSSSMNDKLQANEKTILQKEYFPVLYPILYFITKIHKKLFF